MPSNTISIDDIPAGPLQLNTLSAMPGDLIDWGPTPGADGQNLVGGIDDIVDSCGFQPLPNGGKIWTYRTQSGAIVPHEIVTNIKKMSKKTAADFLMAETDLTKYVGLTAGPSQKELRAGIARDVQLLDISNEAKVAISCLLIDDKGMLILGSDLISYRLKAIHELDLAIKPE